MFLLGKIHFKDSVVKAHVLLILDLNELGGSGVRDFGPA